MEFIPIEKYSKKGKKKGAVVKESKVKKKQNNETIDKSPQKKEKHKPQRKIIQKTKVKEKLKEKVSKKKVVKKTGNKKKKQKEEKEEEGEEEEEEEEEEMELDKDQNKGDEEESEGGEDEEEDEPDDLDEDEDEEAFRKKCKEMDDMKKNRLFLKLKTKILNEAQIKKLHPDIKSVILPRKKNSRWCWAVFVSEERANGAMKKLIKNKDVLVNKPTPYEKVVKKRKEKLKTVLRKKQARKKLQKMWM